MAVKCNVKRCLWLALVVLMSWVLILEGKAVVDAILAHPDLTVRHAYPWNTAVKIALVLEEIQMTPFFLLGVIIGPYEKWYRI